MEYRGDWLPMNSVVKRGGTPAAPRFDIMAKTWNMDKDEFIYRRFTDCYWHAPLDGAARWNGVLDGWLPIAWTVTQAFDPRTWGQPTGRREPVPHSIQGAPLDFPEEEL